MRRSGGKKRKEENEMIISIKMNNLFSRNTFVVVVVRQGLSITFLELAM